MIEVQRTIMMQQGHLHHGCDWPRMVSNQNKPYNLIVRSIEQTLARLQTYVQWRVCQERHPIEHHISDHTCSSRLIDVHTHNVVCLNHNWSVSSPAWIASIIFGLRLAHAPDSCIGTWHSISIL